MARRAVRVGALLAILLMPASGYAQSDAYRVPRTEHGHPDFQGVWGTAFLTPLERPDGVTDLIVSPAQAEKLVAAIRKKRPAVTDPDVQLDDIRTLAQATDAKDAGVDLVQDAAARIDRVRLAVRAAEPVRVAALEWMDPIFVAGHWTPQMIEYAGGLDVLGMPGEHSERRSWEEVAAARPEVVIVMPCGYDAERAAEEAYDFADELAGLGARRVVAVDASAYFSRPGPRLVDGLEVLAHVLYPDLAPPGPSEALPVPL